MKVDRKKVYIGKLPKNDTGFSNLSPAENISFMWELTAEVWSLKKSPYVKRRLPRNITKLIKMKDVFAWGDRKTKLLNLKESDIKREILAVRKKKSA